MATPRHKLVDERLALHYHLISRCVRNSYLCGTDRRTGRKYHHRKAWLISRMQHLAQYFSIEINAYAIMDNHFHLVVFYDPLENTRWSAEQTVDRWFAAFPSRDRNGDIVEVKTAIAKEVALQNPEKVAHYRRTLGSLSMFMKYLKQPIALRANKEDGCSGHFFEQRFYSGALITQEAVVAAMAYVDLNPIRARIAQSIESCTDTSIEQRLKHLRHNKRNIKKAIAPIISGLSRSPLSLPVSLEQYLRLLDSVSGLKAPTLTATSKEEQWMQAIAMLKQRQRAYGCQKTLNEWIAKRRMRLHEKPLPICAWPE